MNVKSLILVVLLLSGCGDVNKSELKELNGYATKVEKIKTEINASKPQLTATIELNETNQSPVAVVKPLQTSDAKFKLALKQIQKNKELKEQANREFELSVTKVANEHILNLKSKDIELSKTEVNSKVSLAEIELKKVIESEKTEQLVQSQTHAETLLENKNRYEKDKLDASLTKDRLEFYKIGAAVIGFLLLLLICYLSV